MSRRPNIENRQRILTAAHRLIYKNGFKGVSMEAIAEAAAVKKANLFHYYPSKEALGVAVFDSAIAQREHSVDEMLGDGRSDPLAAVEALFDAACAKMRENGCSGGCFIGNIAQEVSDCNETLRHKAADHLQRWSSQWTDFLRKKKESGYFRSEMDPRASALGLLSLFEGAMLVSKASRSTAALESAKQVARRHFESFRS